MAIGGRPQDHPWFGYYPFKLILGDEPVVTGVVQQLAEAADVLGAEYARARERLGLDLPPTHPAFVSLQGQVASVPLPSGAEAFELLPGICAEDAVEVVRELEEQVRYVLERMPRLRRMLAAPNHLGQTDLEIAREALGKAAKLDQADIPHPDIQRRGQVLQGLGAEFQQACAFFVEVAQRLGVEVVPTHEGLVALWAALW